MKRIITWLVVLTAVALVAAACGTGTGTTEAPGATEAPSATEAPGGEGEVVELTIESWRNDDLAIWQDQIIPAFEAQYPNISVNFAPTAPAEYNAALQAKLEGGTAGDLITCRPFDASLALFDAGFLAPVTDLPGLEHFDQVARSAWITDDGSTVFCVPMASVIHGFIYNANVFNELGLSEPTTEAEFLELLEAIKQDGTYEVLAMGTADQWEAATMGFQNIGPNYWNGEEGRLALISGEGKLTDQEYVDTFASLAQWGPYLPDGHEAIAYPDAQQLFTLGRAAIYPAGSWEIALFNEQAEFEMGAFPPPLPEAGQTPYISDHVDIALGMNAATSHPDEARTFLEWLTTPEFATIYSNALPGFFSLSDHPVTLTDPLAQEMLDWRNDHESTIRNSYQILSRGEPNLENELWRVSVGVLQESLTPEEAVAELQAGLDAWYTPAG